MGRNDLMEMLAVFLLLIVDMTKCKQHNRIF
ncbi:hypothetical protein T4A_965 [Trichinella pseudospiralis]|uniref:Uncharacterized protein n=1 Tax=Trichinella pseudospiralis TaxID=6337 RepID=A0A0V1B3Z4_TRIPS|nr:hypothetical protein T4A_965 [Trichinella pseudospiralis]